MVSPYETLGVKPDATKEEIKAAFKTLAKKLHSDQGGNDEAFVALRRAHDVLMDDKARQAYDQYGVLAGDEDSKLTAAAAKGLRELFLAIIQANPMDALLQTDIVGKMREILQENAAKLNEQILSVAEKSAHSERLRKELSKRLKCKAKLAPEVMLAALDDMIAQLPGQKAMAEGALKHVERMLNILTDYSFRSNVPPPRMMTFGQFSTTTTSIW